MRKPLVVLCAAAAALAAGGVAANALAQEPPDGPDTADFSIFGEPGLPGLDGDNLLGPFPDVDIAGGGVPGERPGAGSAPGSPDAASPHGTPGSAGSPGSPSPAAASSAPIDPALSDPSPSRVAAAAPPAPAHKPKNNDKTDASRERPQADEQRARPRAGEQRDAPQARGFARPAADPIAAARTAVSPSSVSASPTAPVQQQVLALVNRNRRSHGCGSLSVDRRLIEAANRHAADMARRGYFDHEDSRGDRAGSRVADAGYRWKRYGENIARGQDTPYEVVTDWMNSPQHRENILDCRLDEMGVGLAFDRSDTPYWVQDFATPR